MSSSLPASVLRLISEFSRLPGIGQKSAQRLAFHLLKQPQNRCAEFGETISNLKNGLRLCAICQNLTELETCPICQNPQRNEKIVCVVEEVLDLLALEATNAFLGRYHVLHGVLSPISGVSADDLKIAELQKRVAEGEISEVILALNPTLEGEATSAFLASKLAGSGVAITRLARGLPTGSDLEYADPVTIERALTGRQQW